MAENRNQSCETRSLSLWLRGHLGSALVLLLMPSPWPSPHSSLSVSPLSYWDQKPDGLQACGGV